MYTDEVSLMKQRHLEAINTLLMDLMDCKFTPFGEKVVVLSGDFRQLLPKEGEPNEYCEFGHRLWPS